jgi:four helix bundle protein
MIKSYRDLKVWQLSKEIVKDIYLITKAFPKEELYVLTSQIRRAAISVPSNIAEGHARKGTKEYLHHLSIALGSLAEIETQLELAIDLEFVAADNILILSKKLDETGKMLRGLQQSLANL